MSEYVADRLLASLDDPAEPSVEVYAFEGGPAGGKTCGSEWSTKAIKLPEWVPGRGYVAHLYRDTGRRDAVGRRIFAYVPDEHAGGDG